MLDEDGGDGGDGCIVRGGWRDGAVPCSDGVGRVGWGGGTRGRGSLALWGEEGAVFFYIFIFIRGGGERRGGRGGGEMKEFVF